MLAPASRYKSGIFLELFAEHVCILISDSLQTVLVFHEVRQDRLEYVVRCLGGRTEKTEEFIDHELVREDVRSREHQAQDVSVPTN